MLHPRPAGKRRVENGMLIIEARKEHFKMYIDYVRVYQEKK